jgi:hypothetical protein
MTVGVAGTTVPACLITVTRSTSRELHDDMVKRKHQRRSRPQPLALKRRTTRATREEFDTRRALERWEHQGPSAESQPQSR